MGRIGISKPREAHSKGACRLLSLYPAYFSKLHRVQKLRGAATRKARVELVYTVGDHGLIHMGNVSPTNKEN
jgi:hypothetical protein